MGGDKGREVEKETPKPADGATTKFAEEVAGDRQKLAAADRGQQAADTGEPLKPGKVKNPDGSEVVCAKAADGKVHPVSLKYTNGETIEYTWNKDGKVESFTNRRADNTVRDRWVWNDEKKGYVDERIGPQGMVQTLDITVRSDGTAIGRDPKGNTVESRRDGTLLYQMKDENDKPRKVVVNPDQSAVEYGSFSDGKERVIATRFPDGREVHYQYLRNGSVCDVAEYPLGGPRAGHKPYLQWTSRDGSHWEDANRRLPGFEGRVTLNDRGLETLTLPDGATKARKVDGSEVFKDAGGRVVKETPPIRIPGR